MNLNFQSLFSINPKNVLIYSSLYIHAFYLYVFSLSEGVFFSGLSVVICSIQILLLLNIVKHNVFYMLRVILIASVGVYVYIIKLINVDLYFSIYEFKTQGIDVAFYMYILTLVSLPSVTFGLELGRKLIRTENIVSQEVIGQSIFYLSISLCFIFAYLHVKTSEGTILSVAYGRGAEGGASVGVLTQLVAITLGIAFWVLNRSKNKTKAVYWIIFSLIFLYSVVWGQLLRGLRQDAVMAVASCFFVYCLSHNGLKFKLVYVWISVGFISALEIWGLLRNHLYAIINGNASFSDAISVGLGNASKQDDVIYSGTLGPISTTLSNVVHAFNNDLTPYIYGSSYADYIFRLPPAFISPDRPKAMATYLEQFGLYSGGGFFELAEAYLNFGVAGIILIPFIISLMLAFVIQRAVKIQSMLWVVLGLSLISVWIRGTWYQNFSYFKMLMVGAILFCIYYFLSSVLISKRKIS